VQDLETRTMGKVGRRLVPFLMLCYFFCFLDRVNIGFAALQMNQDLGFTASVYGFGAGILFITYMLCETPSNLILTKVGARRWIARIMVTWGLIAAGMAFVTGETSFYIMRALLGVAEAGFFPGIIFYLMFWFPGKYRGRVTGLFMACIPLSAAIGSPFSTALLYLDGPLGLRGWQWMFVLQGLPSVVLGVIAWFYLTERPREASWLATDEQSWLAARIDGEHHQRHAALSIGVLQTLINPRVLALSAIAFFVSALIFGVSFFLPQIIKAFGLTNMQTGLVTLVPYAVGAAAMTWYGRRSDRLMERKGHLAVALLVAAVGVGAAAMIEEPIMKMAAFTVSAAGLYAALPVFWTLAPAFLSGASAAVGIAYINSWAALGGFVAPYVMGVLKDATGTFTYGLLALGLGVLISVLVVLCIGHDRKLEETPEQALAF
jgi:MFS transporter, ACS family, tartrate transporter